MPPTLSTSWDDSASSAESDDYGDVFGTILSIDDCSVEMINIIVMEIIIRSFVIQNQTRIFNGVIEEILIST